MCQIPGCDLPVHCRAMCGGHYQRWKKGYRGAELEAPLRFRRTNRERATVCTVDGCEKRPAGRDLCGMHYYRLRTWGHVGPAESTHNRDCTVDGCGKPAQARGLCPMHYQRWRSTGDPGQAQHYQTPPGTWTQNVPCVVAACDAPARTKGLCSTHYQRSRMGQDMEAPITKRNYPIGGRIVKPSGYAWVKVGNREWVLEHRVVMEQALGRPLEVFENVHHINGRRDDNRLDNLELWTKPQPNGQRPSDLAEWVVAYYPELVEAALTGRKQLSINI